MNKNVVDVVRISNRDKNHVIIISELFKWIIVNVLSVELWIHFYCCFTILLTMQSVYVYVYGVDSVAVAVHNVMLIWIGDVLPKTFVCSVASQFSCSMAYSHFLSISLSCLQYTIRAFWFISESDVLVVRKAAFNANNNNNNIHFISE